MAEAEDLITDAARHATVFARDIWRRHVPEKEVERPVELGEFTQRLSFLIEAALDVAPPLRIAQPPAIANLLQRLVARRSGPFHTVAVPATDGRFLWLPRDLGTTDHAIALERYRILAVQQAMRATLLRQDAAIGPENKPSPLLQDLYLVWLAAVADVEIARRLPGLRVVLQRLREESLQARPAIELMPPVRQKLEQLVRSILKENVGILPETMAQASSNASLFQQASTMLSDWGEVTEKGAGQRPPMGGFLFKDLWTGELRLPDAPLAMLASGAEAEDDDEGDNESPRSARMTRAPRVRDAEEEEDEGEQGAWMVQTAQPEEHAEDPLGMQRPTDRDESTAAEEFADSLSELNEARLISTPGRSKEILLSDDTPEARSKKEAPLAQPSVDAIAYPEWDYRITRYHEGGATVRIQPPQLGAPEWVAATLQHHASMLRAISRRFEMLRVERQRLRKQVEGDDIDLEAFVDGYADFRAGLPLPQGLYQTSRPVHRDLAICLLIDISGSTDGWVSHNRRIIDVEREALLLVCVALESLGEPYSVQAFSGNGPHNVTMRVIKDFDERYSEEVALRIAALEPERYTRAGAALRHASALLMKKPARQRLLLLLSDGKPNDSDHYEGRYGAEDMRQAVNEAQWQGISPFCLTIDRQAANYLPQVFGPQRYALLPRPELLPTVLLDWMRRLLAS